MARITLRPDEYIIEDPVKLYGPVPAAVFKIVIPAATVIAMALVLRYAFTATDSLTASEATKDIPAYRVMSKLYLPIMVALVLAMAYYLASLFLEKIVLTNQAIIRWGVFSVKRIERSEIASVEMERESFNTINAHRQWSYVVGRLLGISHIVTITGKGGNELIIKNVSRTCAETLVAELQGGRAGML